MAIVCVTGASGFIASWLVKLLLERGYHVRGTVRSLVDPSKTLHLRNLPGANERLELVEANLLAKDSLDAAVEGCHGVFHTASPFFLENVTDPEAQLIVPAVQGTLNLLEACSKHNVQKIVVTSSTASVAYNPNRDSLAVVDENCFSDAEYCRKNKAWYVLSKTLAEQAAWTFAKDKGLNMVTIHPAMVIGPLLQPTLNTSCEIVLHLMDGTRKTYLNAALGWVGVKDVALAHLLAYENPDSSGRYICVERMIHYADFAKRLSELYPNYPVPTKCDNEDAPRVPAYKVSTERLEKLGLSFQPLDDIIKECVQSLKEKGFLA